MLVRNNYIMVSTLLLACAVGSTTVMAQQPAYRDLNKNGKMDPYEDRHLSPEKRTANLMSLMTVEEKAGEMFHTYAMPEKDGTVGTVSMLGPGAGDLITQRKITHFNLVGDVPALSIAKWNNAVQKIAEQTRLGIPVSLSTDPRNTQKPSDGATTVTAGDFSTFPEAIGFAAIRDTALMYQFGKIAAAEYRAAGITIALQPQADLATEPRWSRIAGTFGEDAELAAKLISSYIKGFQGDQLNENSVMCITKHFPGGGPEKDGWEAHFSYGKDLVYPGNNLKTHLIPFQAAIKAGTAGIMTAYGIPVGQTKQDVGASFNKELLTDVLRKKMGFKGLVVSDWNTLTDKKMGEVTLITARGWGVENLSIEEKIIMEITAGVDQIGGEAETALLTALVNKGKIPVALIDAAVRKILLLKFKLGLFDQPYVDESKVAAKIGLAANRKIAMVAQQRSLVLLTNTKHILPLTAAVKLHVTGFDKKAFTSYATVTDSPEQADIAVLHLHTPYGPPPGGTMMERYFHQGRLDFDEKELAGILEKLKAKPTIVVINMERPAVIPEIIKYAAAVILEFGSTETPVVTTLFGITLPQGKLPFDLPASMEEVRAQKEDLPFDLAHPLFRFGYGLNY